MKKRTILTFGIIIAAFSLFAQIPNTFNYQAIARTSTGVIISDQNISLRISVLDPSGSTIYSEIHNITTNSFGLINIQIGDGRTTHNFENINWEDGLFFIKTEIDETGGSNYVELGVSKLQTVPYAMVADTALNVASVWEKINRDGIKRISSNDIIYNSGNVIIGGPNDLILLNNNQDYPSTAYGGGSMSWNYSGGNGELNFWNNYTSSSSSFVFSQMTSPSSHKDLLTIKPNGKIGIGNSNPSSQLSVGTSQGFNVDVSGNIKKINNVATNFPSTQANANTFLKNDGAGNLSWEAIGSSSEEGIYNVMDYGALNNGTNAQATTNAINNALTDLLSNPTFKGVLYFPPGKYLLNSKIDITLPSIFSGITVKGEGPGITVLTFEASAGGGISVNFNSAGGYDNNKGAIIIKDITLETMGSSGGSGIHLNTSTNSPAPHKIIKNVTLTGQGTSNYWTTGIRLTNITFSNIVGVQYQGKSDNANWKGVAVLIEGNNDPVDNFINNLRVWNSDKAVEITGTAEGVTITQSIFLAINKGVHWHTNLSGHEGWLSINNCHISASQECVLGEQLMQCQINNNLFYCQAKAGTNWAGIWVSSNSATDYDFLQITHNTIHGFDNGAIRNGILLNNVKNSLLMGNILYNTITGVSLNNVTDTKVFDNLNFGNANEVHQNNCTGITVR